MTSSPAGSYFETNQMTNLNVANGTVAFWINYSVAETFTENWIVWGLYDTGGKDDYIEVGFDQRGGEREIEARLVEGGVVQWEIQTSGDFGDFNPPRGVWSQFVLRNNGTDPEMFINGSSIWNDTAFLVTADKTAWWDDVIAGGGDVMVWGANRTNGATSPNWNGSFDEIGLWARGLTETEIFDLYNDGAGLTFDPQGNIVVILDKPNDQTITINSTVTFNATLSFAGFAIGNLTNATLLIFNSTGTLINNTVTNQVVGITLNSSGNLIVTGLPFNEYNWSILGCGNDTAGLGICGVSGNFTLEISRFVVNNESFNSQTTEGATETFEIILNVSSAVTFTANLIYNETDEGTGVRTGLGGDEFSVVQTITIPSVATPRNKSFFWRLDFSDGFSTNTTNNTQEVLDLSLNNCTGGGFQLYHYGMVDEEFQTVIANPEIEIAANIFSLNRQNLIANFSQSFNETPATLCTNVQFSNGTSYSFDSVVKYTAPNYAIEYYNVDNTTVNNNTINQSVTLFDLNVSDSTDFQLTFTGADFLVVQGALVFVDRQYVAENVFKTVELPKTDANGQTILHLVRNDIVYNLRVTKNGEVLGNFESIIAFCTDFAIGDCKISLNAKDSTEAVFSYNTDLGITFTGPIFNNNTNVIEFTFLSTDGSTKTVLMSVERNDILGNRSLCNDTLTSAGGSLSCTIINIDQSEIRTIVFVDGIEAVSTQFKLDPSNFGEIGLLMFFIMAMSIILAFSGSKSGVLFGIIISIAGGIGLSLITGDLFGFGAGALWIILVVLVGLWKLNKEKPQ